MDNDYKYKQPDRSSVKFHIDFNKAFLEVLCVFEIPNAHFDS